MSFVPEEELKQKFSLNLAPMIDFLFLMVAFFACLAFSRYTSKETDIELVRLKGGEQELATNADMQHKIIELLVTDNGSYKWSTDLKDYPMPSVEDIQKELTNQTKSGLLPQDKSLTHIVLKIDKEAKWQPILELLYSLSEEGYDAHPLYQPDYRM